MNILIQFCSSNLRCVQDSLVTLYKGTLNERWRYCFVGNVEDYHSLPFVHLILIPKDLVVPSEVGIMCVPHFEDTRGLGSQGLVDYLVAMPQDSTSQHSWFFGEVVPQIGICLNLFKTRLSPWQGQRVLVEHLLPTVAALCLGGSNCRKQGWSRMNVAYYGYIF